MSKLINHIDFCLKKTDNYDSKITNEILEMVGMSGKKTRHFYNNLCSMDDTRYLEIGTWKGSSICSAMCNNKMTCLANDDFSQDWKGNWGESGNIKKEFLNNFNKFKGENNATFIEKNCWTINVNTIGKFNIYLYDGEHSEINQYNALNYYLPCLDNEFIYLIDDWNWEKVRDGTIHAIKKNNLTIIFQKEIFTNNKKHPPWGPGPGIRAGKDDDWHNGLSIFVLKK